MAGWLDRLRGVRASSPSANPPETTVASQPELNLEDDPRWRRIQDQHWICPICKEQHKGLFDLAYNRPDPWQGPEDYEPNAALADALEEGRDFLSEDFCTLGPHRMMRCVLPLRIRGSDKLFSFGVWGSVNPAKFEEVLEYFDRSDAGSTGPYFSWLMNQLPGATRDPIRTRMVMQDDRQRPHLMIEDESHPFFQPQQEGIDFDTLLDLYAQFGHDFRPHLTDA